MNKLNNNKTLPITDQPTAVADVDLAEPQCSAAFDFLTSQSQFTVKQGTEWTEVFTLYETANRYKVMNEHEHTGLQIEEVTDAFSRNILGPSRPFTFNLVDYNSQNVVATLKADTACAHQTMTVTTSSGTLLGSVVASLFCPCPRFSINDAGGQTVCRLQASLAARCGSCSDVVFKITEPRCPRRMATVVRKSPPLLRCLLSDADHFTLEFHETMSPTLRCLVLAAVVHLDMTFYERRFCCFCW